jgi:hypothetical protein
MEINGINLSFGSHFVNGSNDMSFSTFGVDIVKLFSPFR